MSKEKQIRMETFSKRCVCGRCDKSFTPTNNAQKYHPECVRAVMREQCREYAHNNPDKIRESQRKSKKKLGCSAKRDKISVRNCHLMSQMKTENRVHESVAASLIWWGHHCEPLVLHDRRLLKPDDQSPVSSRALEIDIFNPRFNIGYDHKCFWAYYLGPKPLLEQERKRLAEKRGIELIKFEFGAHQKDPSNPQNRISKIAAIINSETVQPASGLVPEIFTIEGTPIPEEIVSFEEEIKLPIVPVEVCSSRNQAVLHPNGHIYMQKGFTMNAKVRSCLKYTYVYLVDNMAPYLCDDNREILMLGPTALLTEAEITQNAEIRADQNEVIGPDDFAYYLFTENTAENRCPNRFKLRYLPEEL